MTESQNLAIEQRLEISTGIEERLDEASLASMFDCCGNSCLRLALRKAFGFLLTTIRFSA